MIRLFPLCLKKTSRLFTPPAQHPRPLSDITEKGKAVLWLEKNYGYRQGKPYTNPFYASWRGWYDQHKQDYSTELEPNQDWWSYEEASKRGKRLFL